VSRVTTSEKRENRDKVLEQSDRDQNDESENLLIKQEHREIKTKKSEMQSDGNRNYQTSKEAREKEKRLRERKEREILDVSPLNQK